MRASKVRQSATSEIFDVPRSPHFRGLFCTKRKKFSQEQTGWLTWQDSNRRMAKSKKAFDPSEEFSTI
jgi:hypothetical protein